MISFSGIFLYFHEIQARKKKMLTIKIPTDKKPINEYFKISVLYSKQAPRLPQSVSCQRIQFRSVQISSGELFEMSQSDKIN